MAERTPLRGRPPREDREATSRLDVRLDSDLYLAFRLAAEHRGVALHVAAAEALRAWIGKRRAA